MDGSIENISIFFNIAGISTFDKSESGEHTKEERNTMDEKRKIFSKEYLIQLIKVNLLPTGIMMLFWMILGWIRAAGIQWAILWPFNFLTGALNGLNGSAVGGTIGKTLLLIMFNSTFRGIIVQRGGWKVRGKNTLKEMKGEGLSALLQKIPQYSNLQKILKKSTPQLLGYSALGLGMAILVYPFITGDGSLVNSMVCIALFVNLGKQLMKQRGFVISLANFILEKRSWKTINKDVVNRMIAGYTLGMALAVPIAALKLSPGMGYSIWGIFAKRLPIVLIVAAFVGIYWDKMGVEKKGDAV